MPRGRIEPVGAPGVRIRRAAPDTDGITAVNAGNMPFTRDPLADIYYFAHELVAFGHGYRNGFRPAVTVLDVAVRAADSRLIDFDQNILCPTSGPGASSIQIPRSGFALARVFM